MLCLVLTRKLLVSGDAICLGAMPLLSGFDIGTAIWAVGIMEKYDMPALSTTRTHLLGRY
eukprot:845764-Rhodomonas_salina.1